MCGQCKRTSPFILFIAAILLLGCVSQGTEKNGRGSADVGEIYQPGTELADEPAGQEQPIPALEKPAAGECSAACVGVSLEGECPDIGPCLEQSQATVPRVTVTYGVRMDNCPNGVIAETSADASFGPTATKRVHVSPPESGSNVASAGWNFCDANGCLEFNPEQRLHWRVLGPSGDSGEPKVLATCGEQGYAVPAPSAINQNVMSIVYNPKLQQNLDESKPWRHVQEDTNLIGHMLSRGQPWHKPEELERQFIDDVYEASHGQAEYEVTRRITYDYWPEIDGKTYDQDAYFDCLVGAGECLSGQADLNKIIEESGACDLVKEGKLNEIWIWGSDYFGFPEHDSPEERDFIGRVLSALPDCGNPYFVMAFNYRLRVGQMLESFAHRAEAVMINAYGRWEYPGTNTWEVFTRFDKVAPGYANCGNVHYAPNSETDYDWNNRNPVESYCDDWYDYPALTGKKRTVTCTDWGCIEGCSVSNCNIREHHKWWLKHIPHYSGTAPDGKLNNWWAYVLRGK